MNLSIRHPLSWRLLSRRTVPLLAMLCLMMQRRLLALLRLSALLRLATLLSLCSLLLSSCASRDQLALYRLTEQELTTAANQHLTRLEQKTKLAGLPVLFRVTQLTTRIAPAGEPKVQLDLQLDGQLQALLAMPFQWQLSLSAQPYFDQNRQALLIRQLKLEHSSISAGQWQTQLKPLAAPLQAHLEKLLLQYPLYQLDANNWQHRLLLNMPLQIRFEPGQLVLSPAPAGG